MIHLSDLEVFIQRILECFTRKIDICSPIFHDIIYNSQYLEIPNYPSMI